jgi:cysteine dioxygenase
MLVCWAPGQRSSIHDHAASDCFLTVLSGGVDELLYAPVEMEAPAPGAAVPCAPPRLVGAGALAAGDGCVSHISNAAGLHALACAASATGGAVSLHCYAPPIRRLTTFDPARGEATSRAPGFLSVRGVPTPQE